MHINRKPGELMEVDWAGQTAKLTDTDTGEPLEAYIFVVVLPYSGYAYAEAFWNMEQESWTAAHVNAYNFFGGVTRILVPDNLKTGVIKHTKNELVLNRSYQEMAEHYGTAIIPTRVRTPKDKATVEGTRICSHVRLYDSGEKYSTQETHMPPNHQQYVQWNGERFRKWAAKIGQNTVTVVETILTAYKVEQQGVPGLYGTAEAIRPVYPGTVGSCLRQRTVLHTPA